MRRPVLTAEELLVFRSNLHMTQEEFAQHLEVALTTVNRWEMKRQPVSRLASNYIRLLRAAWEAEHDAPSAAETIQ